MLKRFDRGETNSCEVLGLNCIAIIKINFMLMIHIRFNSLAKLSGVQVDFFTTFVVINNHILDEVPLIDGHNDLPYNIYQIVLNNLSKFPFDKNLTEDEIWGNHQCKQCYTDLPRLRKGKVGAQFWVAYVSCNVQYKDAVAKTLEQIDVIKRMIKKYPNELQLATSEEDIMEAFSQHKIASLIGVEGGHSIDSRLGVLRMYYDLGVRYMTLTHSCNTPWADNSYIDDAAPGYVVNLTDFGKVVVKEMNRLGMMIDLSHVSHNVMNEAIKISRSPVIFSHSGAYSIRKHNRNIPDDTLLLLKKNKGIAMVNFYPGFISDSPENATIHDVVKHINYIADVAGIEFVGIGSDYDGVSEMPKGLEDASKYPDLFDLLQKENSTRWTNETLSLLAGKNFLRVFKAVEKIKDNLKTEDPHEIWIPIEDLDAINDKTLWTCRTLLNNTSPDRGGANIMHAALPIYFFLLFLAFFLF
ncbi:hypothetical protein FQA39_LY09447 [Lamprigera yunnana]|nr:hypothetical protein FQA39_LY09447 [Lamprigera yunnana]